MFDFLKIRYSDSRIVPKLVKNPLLDFSCELSTSTGESKEDYCIQSEYKNLSFFIYNQKNFYFRGSIHKYFNEGIQNYNDFSHDRFSEVLTELKQKFCIEPANCILQNLEIGLNIQIPFKPSLILNNLLHYKGKEFIKPLHATYYQSQQNRYYIKLYDKGTQYKVKDNNILRFEVKYIKMRDLNDIGIHTLADLQNLENWNNCKKLLLEKWEYVLFHDTSLNATQLSKKERKDLLSYRNPLYWSEIKNRNQRYYHIKRYRKLVENNSQNRHKIIRDLLHKKSDVLTDILNTKTERFNPTILTEKTPEKSNADFGRFNTLNIGLECHNFTPSDSVKKTRETITGKTIKKCQVTGVDISMQRGKSSLLSHTGLRYYLGKDKKVFEKIRNKYLPQKWRDSDLETQIKELAHNIRNIQNNSKVREKQSKEKGQLCISGLFDNC